MKWAPLQKNSYLGLCYKNKANSKKMVFKGGAARRGGVDEAVDGGKNWVVVVLFADEFGGSAGYTFVR